MSNSIKSLYRKIKNHPYMAVFLVFSIYLTFTVICSINFPYLSSKIFPKTSLGIYNKEFWINLLINLNASLIDFAFFGIALFIFQRRNERTLLIQETKNSLSDISKFNDITLNLKKVGLIRRLNEQECYSINMHRLNISGNGVEMRDIKLIDSDLSGLESEFIYINNVEFEGCNIRSSNFQNSKLRNLTMTDCTLKNINFSHSKLKGAIIKECRLIGAKFKGANLQSAVLSGSNLDGVNYEDANLNFANLKDATNIDVSELCKAATLNYVVLDAAIEQQVKALRGDVKFSR